MTTRPVQALSVVAVDANLQVRVGADIVTIRNHVDVIWSVLRYSNGRRDRAEVIEAVVESSGTERGLIGAVVSDLERLGVLVDSRMMHTMVMGYSDNPMPYTSDMRAGEYVAYEHSKGWEPSGQRIKLMKTESGMSLGRSSCRAYQDTPVSAGALGALLQAATDKPPSAGGLYPIRLVLLLNRPTGDLGAGVYHYDPTQHALIAGPMVSSAELRYALNREDGVYNAPAVVLVAGDMKRQTKKYANRGWRYTLIEAGIATDRVVNAATAAGLGSLVFGGYDDVAMSRLVFGDDAQQVRSIVTVAVGYPSGKTESDLDLEGLHDYLDREFVGEGRLVEAAGSTDLWRRPGDLSFHQVLATISPKSKDDATPAEDRTCGGTGASIVAARAKAIVECIERDVSGKLRVDLVGSATQVHAGFDLKLFVPLTDDQVAAHDYLQPFDPEQELQWSEATNLSTGEHVFVPVDLVYYPLSTKALGRPLLHAANSSGVASHTDTVEAQHRALLELIERHAVLMSWHQQEPPAQVPNADWGDYLQRRSAYWASEGYTVRVLDFSLDGVPVAGVAIGSDTKLPGVVFGSAAATTWDAAVTKAFHEAELAVAAHRSLGENPVHVREVMTPLQHGRFHAHDPERTAWRFLTSGERQKTWEPLPPLTNFTALFDAYQPLAVRIDSPWPLHTWRVLSPLAFPVSFGASLEHRPKWSVAPNIPHFIA